MAIQGSPAVTVQGSPAVTVQASAVYPHRWTLPRPKPRSNSSPHSRRSCSQCLTPGSGSWLGTPLDHPPVSSLASREGCPSHSTSRERPPHARWPCAQRPSRRRTIGPQDRKPPGPGPRRCRSPASLSPVSYRSLRRGAGMKARLCMGDAQPQVHRTVRLLLPGPTAEPELQPMVLTCGKDAKTQASCSPRGQAGQPLPLTSALCPPPQHPWPDRAGEAPTWPSASGSRPRRGGWRWRWGTGPRRRCWPPCRCSAPGRTR